MKRKMITIGITGTLGAGKGTIVEHLIARGFHHFSVRGFLVEEARGRGWSINRDTLVTVANVLRAENSPSYIVEKFFEQTALVGENYIIESLRTLGEINALREKDNFYLWAVDADRRLRYERIFLRASETDRISFEEFLANEKRETTSDDPNKQNLSKCIQAADPRFRFINNGTVAELREKIDKALRIIFGEK